MKKTILSTITILTLTACGGGSGTPSQESPNQQENNPSIQEDSNRTNQSEQNSTNAQQEDNNLTSSNEQNSSNTHQTPYVAPTEFTEALIVGKTFYEHEDENEDGVLTIDEWLQFTFSNNQISSARDGKQHPSNNYTLEDGKLFFTYEEDGEEHTDIISIESATPKELHISTTDGDRPIWIIEKAITNNMVQGHTFNFTENKTQREYTIEYKSDYSLILTNKSSQKSLEGKYKIENGKLSYRLEGEDSSKNLIKITEKGDLLMWDSKGVNATWYYLTK